jgi:hypothetical protein
MIGNPGAVVMEAALVALGGGLFTGIVWIIRMLMKISALMRHMGPSVEVLYRIQPFMSRAIRHQNAALKELGADGSTDDSNACLDRVEVLLGERLADREGGKS